MNRQSVPKMPQKTKSASRAAKKPNKMPPLVYEAVRSPGKPLDPGTRTFMDSCFHHDFSRVRVHNDGRAAEAARVVNARAFTLGSDIVFGPGKYSPGTAEGRGLLAHELAHVVQQSRGGPKPATSPSAPHEHDAGAVGSAVMLGQKHVRAQESTGVGLAKQNDKPMTAAHAAGAMGELDAAFVLGKRGFEIVLGPGGPTGHKLTESGFDIVAYHPKSKKLWIVDNKSVGGAHKIQEATAITKNLETNLSKSIEMLKKSHDFPKKDSILKKLDEALKVLRSGKHLPKDVLLVVTNAGGYATGVGKKLAEQGVKFENVVGEAVIKARKADIKGARERGVSPGRPSSHQETEAMRQKVEAADRKALEKQMSSTSKAASRKKAPASASETWTKAPASKAPKGKPPSKGATPQKGGFRVGKGGFRGKFGGLFFVAGTMILEALTGHFVRKHQEEAVAKAISEKLQSPDVQDRVLALLQDERERIARRQVQDKPVYLKVTLKLLLSNDVFDGFSKFPPGVEITERFEQEVTSVVVGHDPIFGVERMDKYVVLSFEIEPQEVSEVERRRFLLEKTEEMAGAPASLTHEYLEELAEERHRLMLELRIAELEETAAAPMSMDPEELKALNEERNRLLGELDELPKTAGQEPEEARHKEPPLATRPKRPSPPRKPRVDPRRKRRKTRPKYKAADIWEQSYRAIQRAQEVRLKGASANPEEKRSALNELWNLVGSIEYYLEQGLFHEEQRMEMMSRKSQLLKEIGKFMNAMRRGNL